MTNKQQLSIQPVPDCEPEIGRVLGMIEDCRYRTREALTDLNPAAVDFVGGFNNHSIGTLLYHIANVELDWLYFEVTEKALPETVWDTMPVAMRNEQGKLSPLSGVGLDDHWQRLDFVRGLLLDVYKPMTLEDYRRPRALEKYDVTPEWVLHHLMQHEAGHRDELELLRQMASQSK